MRVVLRDLACGTASAPTTRVFTRLRNTAGTSILEAAIVTPLLLLLTFAIVDFGGLFYVYLALENGVSLATRYGVTGAQADDPAKAGAKLSREDSIKLAMREATPTLTIPDTAFTFAHRSVGGASWVAGTGGPNDIEKVTVDYAWNFLTPVLWPFFANGKLNMTVDSVMKNEGRFE
jgi:Flp pilus assembly protein TadG